MAKASLGQDDDAIILVVMGPAGAGKSTVGAAVADAARVPFYEGDAFHPPENVAKIRAGQGLDLTDRKPWIAAIGAAIKADAPGRAVLACSALNRSIRELLKAALPGEARFVLLDVPKEELLRRLSARRSHFAGPELLESQLAAMDPAEEVTRVDGTRDPSDLASELAPFLKPAP